MAEIAILGVLDPTDPSAESRYTQCSALIQAILPIHFTVSCVMFCDDQKSIIASHLRRLAQEEVYDLILTTGGTGLKIREWTPEATKEVIDREVPGLAEYMRIQGMMQSPRSVLFRGVAGFYGSSLICNLPGGPKAIQDTLPPLIKSLEHAAQFAEKKRETMMTLWG